MFKIYQAVNKINGKSYIGVDSAWPHRKSDHKRNALIYKQNFMFYNAIRKYGWDNFEWLILYETKDYKDALQTECLLIKDLNTFRPNGYNMTLGGEGTKGHIVSKKNRKLVSERMKLAIRTPESNLKRSLKLQGIKRSPFTKSHKEKLVQAHIKTYYIIFPNGKEQLITNMAAFCRKYGLDKSTMNAIVHNKRNHKSHKGFKARLA